jgi:hypothetical protein
MFQAAVALRARLAPDKEVKKLYDQPGQRLYERL